MENREANRLALFKKKMQPTSVTRERKTSIHNAFASAIALVGKYNEEAINEALVRLGQGDTSQKLICVYCGNLATTADHLTGLVADTRYSGHGQVIGNLVPCCSPCNSSKGNKSWRVWCRSPKFLENRPIFSEEQVARLEDYESLAPPAIGHAELMVRHPDLMTKYDALKKSCLDAMAEADGIAEEIQRREKKRRADEVLGGIAGPDEPTDSNEPTDPDETM